MLLEEATSREQVEAALAAGDAELDADIDEKLEEAEKNWEGSAGAHGEYVDEDNDPFEHEAFINFLRYEADDLGYDFSVMNDENLFRISQAQTPRNWFTRSTNLLGDYSTYYFPTLAQHWFDADLLPSGFQHLPEKRIRDFWRGLYSSIDWQDESHSDVESPNFGSSPGDELEYRISERNIDELCRDILQAYVEELLKLDPQKAIANFKAVLSKTFPSVLQNLESAQLSEEDVLDLVSTWYTEDGQEDVILNLNHYFDALKNPDTSERKVIAELSKQDIQALGITKGAFLEEAPWKLIKLIATDLRMEGTRMRHCVGTTGMSYIREVAAGNIEIWSLRDRNGKPRFTVEVDRGFYQSENKASYIKQLKGKANRKPGYAKVGSSEVSFQDEVLVWDKLLKDLGVNPRDVSDFGAACKLPSLGEENRVQASFATAGLVSVKTNFSDADFWLIRKGTPDKVGTVTSTFDKEHIGLKVTDTEKLLPQYLKYLMQYMQQQGFFKSRATGTTALVNIKVADVKAAIGSIQMPQAPVEGAYSFDAPYRAMPYRVLKLLQAMTREEALAALGFSPGSSPELEAIKKAWKKRAATTHPDQGGNAQEMADLNVAKEILDGVRPPDRTKPSKDYVKPIEGVGVGTRVIFRRAGLTYKGKVVDMRPVHVMVQEDDGNESWVLKNRVIGVDEPSVSAAATSLTGDQIAIIKFLLKMGGSATVRDIEKSRLGAVPWFKAWLQKEQPQKTRVLTVEDIESATVEVPSSGKEIPRDIVDRMLGRATSAYAPWTDDQSIFPNNKIFALVVSEEDIEEVFEPFGAGGVQFMKMYSQAADRSDHPTIPGNVILAWVRYSELDDGTLWAHEVQSDLKWALGGRHVTQQDKVDALQLGGPRDKAPNMHMREVIKQRQTDIDKQLTHLEMETLKAFANAHRSERIIFPTMDYRLNEYPLDIWGDKAAPAAIYNELPKKLRFSKSQVADLDLPVEAPQGEVWVSASSTTLSDTRITRMKPTDKAIASAKAAILEATKALKEGNKALKADSDLTPKAYVVDLAKYNNGDVTGAWIDLSDDSDAIMEQIQAVVPEGTDWAFHDYEDFPTSMGENPSIDDVAELVGLIEEHGEKAIAIFDNNVAHLKEILGEGVVEFEEGEDDALASYAEELHSEGALSDQHVLRYIDWKAVGRDLGLTDYGTVYYNGKTYIYRSV